MVYDILEQSYIRHNHVDNSILLAVRGNSALHAATYFQYIATIRVRFNACVGEEELEPGDIMMRKVNNFNTREGLKGVMEGFSGIPNTGVELISGSNEYG